MSIACKYLRGENAECLRGENAECLRGENEECLSMQVLASRNASTSIPITSYAYASSPGTRASDGASVMIACARGCVKVSIPVARLVKGAVAAKEGQHINTCQIVLLRKLFRVSAMLRGHSDALHLLCAYISRWCV